MNEYSYPYMECPICFEKYAEGNAAFGPGGDCTHTACERCWRKTGTATRPPFKCAECRRDVTAWFVEAFSWVDPQTPERVEAELLQAQEELEEELRTIRNNAAADRIQIFEEAQARMTLNNERFQADMAVLMALRRG